MNKITKTILFAACVIGLFGLVSMRAFHDGTGSIPGLTPEQDRQNTSWNIRAIDNTVSLLKQGNVVLRMGDGVHSHLLAQMNRHNKSYSHCGIVMMENGYPFVYHSIGGEDNPDSRLRRDSAHTFFSHVHNSAIAIVKYKFTARQQKALNKIVHSYYIQRPKFDLKFDLATDDKLYCTEFAYKAINAATADTGYIPTTEVAGRRFVGTDNLYVNAHASLVWQVKFK